MSYILPDLNLLEISHEISDEGKTGLFKIEPLSPGYGVTIGNTLRRILLASLEGSAVRSVKIEGVDHEYSTIKGVKEDIVDIILNLKMSRFKLNGDEPAKITLSAKGPKVVTLADFKENSQVETVDPDHYICTLEKGGKIEMELEIDKGRGYIPVEKRSENKNPIGTIMIDSIYTPVKKVKYTVDNARVGGDTNYNQLVMEITTDGSISPQEALSKATKIMCEHLEVIAQACDNIKPSTKTKKSTTKKKQNGKA